MKHNDAKVCVIYRTLPKDSYHALVVGTATLSDTYHNSLMNVVESIQGQQANELGDVLSTRFFSDGTNMLEQLHFTGKLVKVATNTVIMTPTTHESLPLNELNVLIAEQKGVKIDDLSIKADMPHRQNKTSVQDVEIKDLATVSEIPASKEEIFESVKSPAPTTASDYRSQADKLYKEAARLRKIADELDPPKKKKTVSASQNKEEV
jgi:hypothetical protein